MRPSLLVLMVLALWRPQLPAAARQLCTSRLARALVQSGRPAMSTLQPGGGGGGGGGGGPHPQGTPGAMYVPSATRFHAASQAFAPAAGSGDELLQSAAAFAHGGDAALGAQRAVHAPERASAAPLARGAYALNGRVERVLYCSGPLTIVQLDASSAAGRVRVLSSTGSLSGVREGDELKLVGVWRQHRSYGWQMDVSVGEVVRQAAAVEPPAYGRDFAAPGRVAYAPAQGPGQRAHARGGAADVAGGWAQPRPATARASAAAADSAAAIAQGALHPRPAPPAVSPTARRGGVPVAAAARPAETTALRGTVKQIVHRGRDGFTVLRMLLGDTRTPTLGDRMQGKRKGRTKTVVVQSAECLAMATVGQQLTVSGHWVRHPKFGEQFDAMALKEEKLEPREFVLAFLTSRAIKGVGPVFAKRIIEQLGDDAIGLTRGDSGAIERLRQVPGIGPKKFEKIAQSVRDAAGTAQIVSFCGEVGISMPAALQLWELHGADAAERVRENPYRLLDDLPGFGFQRADHTALRLGHTADATYRLEGALKHNLAAAASDGGHCYLDAPTLIAKAQRTLASSAFASGGAATPAVADALARLVASEALVMERLEPADAAGAAQQPRARLRPPSTLNASKVTAADLDGSTALYLPGSHEAEVKLARALKGLLSNTTRGGGYVEPSAVRGALEDVRRRARLTDEQQRAIELAASGRRLLVLTGGPGTGKTLTLEHIVRLWCEQGKRVRLACPTARGAAVLSEITGVKAQTVHRLLEFNPLQHAFARDYTEKLPADVVVVDEASMLDVTLANGLLDALPLHCTLLLVGDADQLPSVGAGQVLRDVLDCEKVDRVRLAQVFRYDSAGAIAYNAQRVNRGEPMAGLHCLLPDEQPPVEDSVGCKLVLASSAAEASDTIASSVLAWVERAGFDLHADLQVLSPTTLGVAGTVALNRKLQLRLNPNAREQLERCSREGVPRPPVFKGDRMIQLRNEYDKDIFNGDVGTIADVDEHGRTFRVAFPNAGSGEPVLYTFKELHRRISLAYALTVHKAQGSEYPVVVVPALSEHSNMLYRHLLYTAVSRAKQLLVLVGSHRALETCVQNDSRRSRLTRLTHRIGEETLAFHEIDPDAL